MKKVRGRCDHCDGVGVNSDLPILVWRLPRNYKIKIYFMLLILVVNLLKHTIMYLSQIHIFWLDQNCTHIIYRV